MRTILATIILCATCHASHMYLVLTPAQFTTANNWLNEQNGWPDGNGTVTYAQPLQFSHFSNCPAPLQDRVGLVLDKALIRHCRQAGETKQDAIIRVATTIRNNLSNPTVVRVVQTGDEENPTADFTDVTATVVEKVKELVK